MSTFAEQARSRFAAPKPEPNGQYRKSVSSATKNARPTRGSFRFATLNALIDQHLATLKATESIVWFVIWRHVNNETGTAKLSHQGIAAKAGLKRRAVINATKRLEHLGLLEVVCRGGPDHSVNVYKPTTPATGAPGCT